METIHYSNEDPDNEEEKRYRAALKQVKKQRGFYIHLIVYICVNAYLIINSVFFGHVSWHSLELYSTPFFWGIGLAAHGLSVFVPLVGKDWEDRKIKEYMEKERRRSLK